MWLTVKKTWIWILPWLFNTCGQSISSNLHFFITKMEIIPSYWGHLWYIAECPAHSKSIYAGILKLECVSQSPGNLLQCRFLGLSAPGAGYKAGDADAAGPGTALWERCRTAQRLGTCTLQTLPGVGFQHCQLEWPSPISLTSKLCSLTGKAG